MGKRDGLLPGERSIPQGYDGVGAVQKILGLGVEAPQPFRGRLPRNGTVFGPDRHGRPLFPDGGDDIFEDEIDSRQITDGERRLGVVDRFMIRMFSLLDRFFMRM